MNDVLIDVTVLEPRMKHPTIFDAFDKLTAGEAVVIHNDHDPKPLYYQLLGERGNGFSWTYLQNGPETWEVEIRKNAKETETVGEIAAKDMRKAEKFKKLGIDFCCGGKKTLEEACLENGLDVMKVQQELDEAGRQPVTAQPLDFNSWPVGFLVDYIVNVHHAYVKDTAPMLYDLSHKVAGHHGASNPMFVMLNEVLVKLLAELTAHMEKEEEGLFPYIQRLSPTGTDTIISLNSTKDYIAMLEHEHDEAGALVKEMKRLTNGFTPPENACNSIRLLYSTLEAFEGDLFRHVHLENNILFPKAMALIK